VPIASVTRYDAVSYTVSREFTIDFRRVEGLDAMVALSMASEGTGAALYLLSSWVETTAGMLVGLALVALGVLTLFFHLGHPLKFWRVVARSRSAWISRGAAATSAFLAFGVLALVVDKHLSLSIAFQTLAFVGGMTILLYSGLILSSMRAVPFWDNAVIPLAFFFQSFASASLICMLVLLVDDGRNSAPLDVVPLAAGLVLIVAALLWTLVKSVPRSGAADRARASLLRGSLRRHFVLGSLVLGIVVPFIVVVIYSVTVPGHKTLAVVATAVGMVSRCLGDLSFRYSLIKAGLHEPLVEQDER
jgi:formate-dependent nitrite reductase membrane component NrfD